MKIAAFHDKKRAHQSLLQFVGRFTRTNKDNNLGNEFYCKSPSAYLSDELILYAKESNWNSILPTLSFTYQEQIGLQEFLAGFNHLMIH